MVHKVIITDNSKAPIGYLSDLDNFHNGKEYTFKPGVNIIVGENGCGKTTLMNIIKKYLLVDYTECSKGAYNCNINALYHDVMERKGFYDGIDVYADYQKNTFRLSHAGEKERMQAIETIEDFAAMVDQKSASTGEGVFIALNSLFSYIFSKKAKLTFDYSQFDNSAYGEYIKRHRVEGDEWTILMDEPDRNLSLDKLDTIKEILSYHKPKTQIIAVIHNPILIYSLSRLKNINFIEMTKDYILKTQKALTSLLSPSK